MFVNKVKLLKTIKRTNIKLVTDSTTVEEAGSGGFWFPKMASRIINSQLRSLGRQCLLALPIENHTRWSKRWLSPARGTGFWEQGHQQHSWNHQLSGTLGVREVETVNIFLYFCRKIPEVNRDMEFNSWPGVFYIQLFGSILIQCLWIFWLENTALPYHLLYYDKKKKSLEGNIVFTLKVNLQQEICSTRRSGDSHGR